MTPDWEPGPAERLEAIKRGVDPHEAAARFRDHYLHTAELSGNWPARYRTWVRDDAKRAQSQQRGMLMPIGGRRTALDAQAERTAAMDEMRATARAVRREREEREGRVA
jgi:hypothetical protein